MEQVLQISFSLILSLSPYSNFYESKQTLPSSWFALSLFLFCVGHFCCVSLPFPFPAWNIGRQPDCHCTTLYVMHSNHWAHHAHANTITHAEADMHTKHFRQMLFRGPVWSVLLSPLQTSHILDEVITCALNALLCIPLNIIASGKCKHNTFYSCICL